MSPAALSASCCSPASRSFASLRSLWPGLAARAVSFGKSDSIDALAVAHAALRYRDKLPVARLAGVERDIALLLDHRESMINKRTRLQNRPRWQLHVSIHLKVPARKLDLHVVLERVDARLARFDQSPQVRICRELVRRCRELTKQAAETEQELAILIRGHAHPLLGLPGVGVLTAAKLIAEVANIERSESDRQLAKLAGVAPLDASSGKQQRHRLNRTGNRQLNRALHTIAITQARIHQPAATTSPAGSRRARQRKKRCEHSNAIPPGSSTGSSTTSIIAGKLARVSGSTHQSAAFA